MSVVAIIPARLGSTRLPGKPLLNETGKYLIQHVVEQVGRAKVLDKVLVATDDERIVAACERFGADAVMTRPDHQSGTDRIAEVADGIGLADDDIVVNVQGDEPEIPPSCVADLVELLQRSSAPMATLATPLDAELADDPNRVKVVFDVDGRAMYFSRSRIPYLRDGGTETEYYQHLGIYAYRAGFLREFTRLPQTPAERAEKLEQLRALQHGRAIMVGAVLYSGEGIDTPEDYAAFVRRCRAGADKTSQGEDPQS